MPANDRCAIPAAHFSYAIGALSVLASVVSLALVITGATSEPYVAFHPADALWQVGVGFLLMGVWFVLAAVVCHGVVTSLLARGWLFLLPWIGIMLFYVRLCPFGYVDDIARHVISP
jgi:hypothetical protein